MVDYESSGGGGNWTDVTKWTPTPPAGGPAQNDKAAIKNGHPITIPIGVAVSIGDGSDQAVYIEDDALLVSDEDSTMNLYGEIFYEQKGTHQVNPGAILDQKVDGLNYHRQIYSSGAGTYSTGIQMVGTQAKPIKLRGGDLHGIVELYTGGSFVRTTTHVMEWVDFEFNSVENIYGPWWGSTNGILYLVAKNLGFSDMIISGVVLQKVANTTSYPKLYWENWGGKITTTSIGASCIELGRLSSSSGSHGYEGYIKNVRLANSSATLSTVTITCCERVSTQFEIEDCIFENLSTGPVCSFGWGLPGNYLRDQEYLKFKNCQYLTNGPYKWKIHDYAGGTWHIDEGSNLLPSEVDIVGFGIYDSFHLIIAKQQDIRLLTESLTPIQDASIFCKTGKQNPVTLRPYDNWAEVTEATGRPDPVPPLDWYEYTVPLGWVAYSDGVDEPEMTFAKDGYNQWSDDNGQNFYPMGTPYKFDPEQNITQDILLRSTVIPPPAAARLIAPINVEVRQI